MHLSKRFNEALVFASELHAGQVKGKTGVPYIAHLLGVTSLVLEHGGDEDEAIAALLHDAIEDQGGKPTGDAIRIKFGDRVADIVWACTDTDRQPPPPWRQRKEQYLAHVAENDKSALLVSVADKLYNVRAILLAFRHDGKAIWQHFNGTRKDRLWYYRSLVTAFRQHAESPKTLVDEFHRVVSEIEQLLANRQ